jgi:MerR family transcriptional regulator, repressor of the yfmOP operon
VPTLYQIGDVVERSGLTHRALHYYDEIGLLTPGYRLEGGLRLYTEDDLSRLERVLELRRLLGLSLHEIKALLEAEDARSRLLQAAGNETDPASRRADLEQALAIAERQLAQVHARLEQTRLLARRLEATAAELRAALGAAAPVE